MASWKKILAFDTSPTVNNSFVTVNTDNSVEVVSFNDLDTVPLSTYDSVSERLTEEASNFLFAVHDVSGSEHRKVTFDDIAGAVTVDAINTVIAGGGGDVATFTGSTSGVFGDLNDDGSVSTADLLQFLTVYGQPPTLVYDDGEVDLTACPTTTVNNDTGGAYFDPSTGIESDLDQLEISNPTVSQGAFTVNVDTTNDKITISEGSGVNWNSFANKAIKVVAITTGTRFVSEVALAFGAPWLRVRTYNPSSVLINSSWIQLTGYAAADDAGQNVDQTVTEDILIGGSNNSNGIDLSNTNVDSVEIEVYFNDVSGFVSTAEIENLTLELIVSG